MVVTVLVPIGVLALLVSVTAAWLARTRTGSRGRARGRVHGLDETGGETPAGWVDGTEDGVALSTTIRVLRTEEELREAVERAVETERTLASLASRRAGRYARLGTGARRPAVSAGAARSAAAAAGTGDRAWPSAAVTGSGDGHGDRVTLPEPRAGFDAGGSLDEREGLEPRSDRHLSLGPHGFVW